jgi:hypothetical protein
MALDSLSFDIIVHFLITLSAQYLPDALAAVEAEALGSRVTTSVFTSRRKRQAQVDAVRGVLVALPRIVGPGGAVGSLARDCGDAAAGHLFSGFRCGAPPFLRELFPNLPDVVPAPDEYAKLLWPEFAGDGPVFLARVPPG